VVGKAIFQGKRGGYFVDLAANHPLLKSNTRTIERDFGWRGLCIDGNEEFLMLLLKRRTCQVVGAIVSSEADADVQYRRWHGGGGAGSTGTWQHALSGIVGFDNKADNGSDPIINKYASKTDKGPGYRDVKSASTRLEDILRRHNAPSTIEYLSLDVEGAEEAVMRNFAFDSYTFLVVVRGGDTRHLPPSARPRHSSGYCPRTHSTQLIVPVLCAASVQTIERPSENLQRILATKGYVFVTDMPGGFGEKLFLHNAIPGGVAAVTVRVQAEIVQYEADKEALKRKKG
jgi:hypothetical protein